MSPVRRVLPELLDDLPAEDPRARRSRRDLQRVHYAMGTLSILRRALARLRLVKRPERIIEIGAGDGTLMLRLLGALRREWPGGELTLLDRQEIVSPQTLEAFERLGWRATLSCADVLAWAQASSPQRYDLCIATLFLHHFDGERLDVLLRGIAAQTQAFVACEPRRDWAGWLGSHLIGFMGANQVTREDAATSVAAGFSDRELTQAWPAGEGDWAVEEYPARPFGHCFVAARVEGREGSAARGR